MHSTVISIKNIRLNIKIKTMLEKQSKREEIWTYQWQFTSILNGTENKSY